MRDLPLVHDDLPALDHDPGIEQVPVTLERVSVEDDDVGELAGFEGAKLAALLDESIRNGAHELHEILRREHDVEG